MRIDDRTEVTLHLKLPGDLSLDEAHEIASQVEAAISRSLPEVDAVQTHLEPLTESMRIADSTHQSFPQAAMVRAAVRDLTGAEPREMRLLDTDEGPVVFLTLGVAPDTPLSEAHARASAVEALIRESGPEIADVIVHTEP